MKQLVLSVMLLVAIIVLPGQGQAFTGENWEKIYAADSSGNATYGDIDDLVDAINNGFDVKVLQKSSAWTHAFKTPFVAKNTTTYGDVVYARTQLYVPICYDSYGYPDLCEYQVKSIVLRSDGVLEVLAYDPRDYSIISHTSTTSVLEWYISR